MRALVPDPAVMRLRAVHRALADLRRGTPVLLRGGSPHDAGDLVMLPAETAGQRGLAELSALASGPPILLLAPARASVLLGYPLAPSAAVAFATDPALLQPDALRGLADPTAAQMVPLPATPATVPAAGPAALALLKLARLLPAALAAPAIGSVNDSAVALGVLSVQAADVLAYPAEAAASLSRVAEARVPLEGAPNSRIVAFRATDAGVEHLAILIGQPEARDAPLVRLHSECFTGDLLGSLRCDCGPQLREAIRRMGAEGAGAVLYLAQEGRGIGLANKLRAYALQDGGLDTLDANRALGWGVDERGFLIAATMLQELGLSRVRLLTNNPEKLAALAACGIVVAGRESLIIPPNGQNDGYLAAKAARMGHLL